MVKILHIFGQMQRGGAEMRTIDLMRYIDRKRYQFSFCVLSGMPGELDEQIRSLGGKIHYTSLGVDFPRRFRQILRNERFQVVQSHVHYFSGLILRMAAQENVPVRITHFRITNDGQGNGVRRRLQRSIMKRWINLYSTHILSVSRGTMSEAWGSNWQVDGRCKVIYNGLPPTLFSTCTDPRGVFEEFHIPSQAPLYIHVGRMDEQKNHERLITIFAEILKRDPHSYLLLVGRGGNEIEQRIRIRLVEQGISGRVTFAGVRSDVPRLLTAADLMIFPSLREGLPGAVLEASAVGTPVLASEIPGVIEIASEFPLVRYLSLRDSDDEWAKAAVALRLESRSDEVRAAATRAFATSKFTISDCVRSHYAIWDSGYTNG